MTRSTAVLRAVARVGIWVFAVLLVAAAVWLAVNRMFDAPATALRDPFLVSPDDQVSDSKNIAVGVLGLNAPPRSDIFEYGARIKALYTSNAPYSLIRELEEGPGTLQPTVQGGQLTCWLDPDWTVFKGCLPFDQASTVLAANKELLDRFKSLYGVERYVGLDVPYSNSQTIFTLLRLSVAEIQLALRSGEHESAYRKWRDLMRFVKRRNRGTDTWVGKAIGLVAMGMTLPVLESLLMANPDTAKLHASELYELLRPEGIAAYDPNGIVRAEFALLRHSLENLPSDAWQQDRLGWLIHYLGQKNRILNRYASFAPEYAATLRLPWSEQRKQMVQLREKYVYPPDGDFVLDPIGSIFSVIYIDGELKAREMVHQMYVVDGRFRLATLLVRQINERVGDSGIDYFLAAAPPELRDPFFGRSMRWDPKERKIYFTDPDEKCTIDAWFRVPNLNRPPHLSPSTVNTNAC